MKETTMLGVVFIVAILVVGGLVYTYAPIAMDRLNDLWDETFGGGLGSDNQAQLMWFVNYTDGSSENIDPMDIFYQDKAVKSMGFQAQVKFNFNAESATIIYNVDLWMGIDGTPKKQHGAFEGMSMPIDSSGEWYTLKGASISFRAETIESWVNGELGNHVLKGEVELSVKITYDSNTEVLSGSAKGTAGIVIEKNVATMEIMMRPISWTGSVYPLT